VHAAQCPQSTHTPRIAEGVAQIVGQGWESLSLPTSHESIKLDKAHRSETALVLVRLFCCKGGLDSLEECSVWAQTIAIQQILAVVLSRESPSCF
jgi:hypothetical protein